MYKSLLNKNGKDALIEYIEECMKFDSNIDKDIAFTLTLNAIKYYNGNKSVRDSLRILQEAEIKWYESLDNNKPDFSVYDDSYYLSDLWACWIVYSRPYLLSINSPKSLPIGKSILQDMEDIRIILDLGCGFGYTTGVLKEYFKKAVVYGTNLENTAQYKIATEIGKQYNFHIISDLHKTKLSKIDLIFASEYFEHIEKPVKHLIDIITTNNPRYLIIANAFSARSVGHFNIYLHGRLAYTGRDISKLFNNTLRLYGYKKIETTLWNSRPTYWKKIKEHNHLNPLFK